MSWKVIPCGKRVSTHTRIPWVELPIWFLYNQEKLCVLIEISTSFHISVYFWDALWLCYQLIMHAYSNTDLRKFNLCKFFSAFLVFQCGASGRSTLTSGQTGGPDGDGSHMSRQDLTEFGRALSSSSERSLYIVWTRATVLFLSEAASVRTSSIHCPDGDPTATIKCPDRRILFIPHKIRFFGCLWVRLALSFLAFCIYLSYFRYFSSLFLFSFFFKKGC
jgi:hypothetical protein